MMNTSPFIHNNTSIQKLMLKVQIATIPGLLVHMYFFGFGIVIQLALGLLTLIIVESILLKMRGRPVIPFLSDLSGVITVSLMVFSMPPDAPWWLIVSGVSFALVFGKHIFGGIGYNPFNPAMLGYAFLLISFPAEMSQWTLPSAILGHELSFMNSLHHIFTGNIPNLNIHIDQITGATPLEAIKTGLATDISILQSLSSPLFHASYLPYGWAEINIAFLIGGLWLLFTRSIRWQYPVGFLGAIALMAFIFNTIDPQTYAPVSVHLFSGGVMLAAFFIITDPVTSSTTPRGRLIFAIGVGCLVYIIRNWGAFPEGIAFAVLLLNMCVPLIDKYTAPRVAGHKK